MWPMFTILSADIGNVHSVTINTFAAITSLVLWGQSTDNQSSLQQSLITFTGPKCIHGHHPTQSRTQGSSLYMCNIRVWGLWYLLMIIVGAKQNNKATNKHTRACCIQYYVRPFTKQCYPVILNLISLIRKLLEVSKWYYRIIFHYDSNEVSHMVYV